jgi:hypothetical protein
MESRVKKMLLAVAILATVTLSSRAQGEEDDQVAPRASKYLGLGMGLDYGGLGAKLEIMPTRHLGLFAGVGYDLLSVGWNAGASLNFSPGTRVSPVARVFYGYNSTLRIVNASSENMTSYGISLGGGVDTKRRNGDVWSFSLFIPFRSKKFKDHFEDVKARIDDSIWYSPVLFSIGYNFKM